MHNSNWEEDRAEWLAEMETEEGAVFADRRGEYIQGLVEKGNGVYGIDRVYLPLGLQRRDPVTV